MWSGKNSALLRSTTHCALRTVRTAAKYAVFHTTGRGDCRRDIRSEKKTHSLKLRFKLLLSLKPRIIWPIGFVIWAGKPEVFL